MSNCTAGTARHGTARHGTARHGTARHGTARQVGDLMQTALSELHCVLCCSASQHVAPCANMLFGTTFVAMVGRPDVERVERAVHAIARAQRVGLLIPRLFRVGRPGEVSERVERLLTLQDQHNRRAAATRAQTGSTRPDGIYLCSLWVAWPHRCHF